MLRFSITRKQVVISAVLAAITFAAFARLLGNGFIKEIDDGTYILVNSHVNSGLSIANILWAFSSPHSGLWLPVTWISHMLDCQLFGLNPMGHHLVSLLLHIANTILLFLLLCRITKHVWRSAFVAALFAVHPLHVQSVAWAAERKDVLSTLFLLLTMWAYVSYTEKRGAKGYALALLIFTLGLMSKPMLVSLPFILLLIDYWPLRRFETGSTKVLLLEKLPFFILAIAFSSVTFLAHKSIGSLGITSNYPIGDRVENALVAYVAYLGKMIWPIKLSLLYRLPAPQPIWKVAGAIAILLSITAIALLKRRHNPEFLVGWLWYVVSLLPVIGLVQAGMPQATADRFTYVPLVGVFIMIVWGIVDLFNTRKASSTQRSTKALAVAGCVVVLLLACVTYYQVGFWHDNNSLFSRSLQVTPSRNLLGQFYLGLSYKNDEQYDKAEGHFRAALQVASGVASVHKELADTLVSEDKLNEAVKHFKLALKLNPNASETHYQLGLVLSRQGYMAEAEQCYLESLTLNPNSGEVHYTLGVLLGTQGRIGDAINHLSKAAELDSNNATFENSLAMALASNGNLKEAFQHFSRAIDIDPQDETIYFNIGLVWKSQGNNERAAMAFKQALELNPNDADAHRNLGIVLVQLGRRDEAESELNIALQLNPSDVEARKLLLSISHAAERSP